MIASATLAILLVCFSIYQYGLADPDGTERSSVSRLPAPPVVPVGFGGVDPAGGLEVGEGTVGPGEKVHITFYRHKADVRSSIEVSVDSLAPGPGVANELLLVAPEFRMRTTDGHAVRVTADQGRMEAPRRAGAGLEPKRGRLFGHVVIEYDRLTETERALLPEAIRDRLDPDDLIRIEVDELLFDFEYSKVSVPGRLRLTSRDAELEANDLELRFNDLEDRLEYLRIARGGRIALLGTSDRLSLSGSDDPNPGQKQTTVSQWLLATVRSALLKKTIVQAGGEETPDPSPAPQSAVTYTDEGIPVFDLDATADETPTQPVRYYARFHGDVDVRQTVGDTVQARLQADLLELVRAVTNRDASQKRDAGATGVPQPEPTTESADERLVLTWQDRLVVEPCAADDQRCAKDARATVSATGSPARITTPEGDVRCQRFTYNPDGSRVQLFGTQVDPVFVQFGEEGTLTGLTVFTERRGDDFFIRATGKGSLTNGELGEVPVGPGSGSIITFDDGFEARGRMVTRTRIDLTGQITTRTERILSRATFRGRVQVHTADAGLGADTVTVTFGPRVGAGGRMIDRIHAEGHVVMTRQTDQLTCRQIEMSLTATPDGRTVLRQAIAYGQVVARQGGRTIEAREKLIVDFHQVDRRLPPFDPAAAYNKAVSAGVDPLTVDWAAKRREYEASRRVEVVVSRLRAEGEVRILDAGQALDVAANTVDCAVSDSGDIQTASIEGSNDQPATVRLAELSVTGAKISLNVPDESADVPGAGRMTFRSQKDLDGRRLAEPVPISITWTDWMKYRGRQNRSVFEGKVHCSSQTTTFDSDRLEVDFVDVVETSIVEAPAQDWWIFQDVVERFSQSGSEPSGVGARGFRKEPAYVLATGRAVALTTDLDPVTGATKGRARIAGPMLWVDLRKGKMQIEGPGTLLLEDYPSVDAATDASEEGGGLFQIAGDGGPSNTLIEWQELMWYDFAANRMRFEGDVSLKHFSGAELMRVRGRPAGESTALPPGRATYLSCRTLTVDFTFRRDGDGRKEARRMGRLSSERLSQFHAEGAVRLQDESEGLYLTAARLIYWKARETLAIHGSPGQKAHIVLRRAGELPTQMSVYRFLYNLTTGLELAAGPRVRSR